ncbi:MAG: DNA topoisomerase 4 subunit A [Clostridia bacterium]|nr:DNA topoisomerase 4 subunit A [Clostridia bacterium]
MAKKRDDQISFTGETILTKGMDAVMHDSMIPYAEYVIMERALPRIEDGLKPVQRRILYTMMELGLMPDKPHRKSARIVGDCLGKYHPHGDTSVYDAMVRMAQGFNMQMPMVDGHGNFGSVDGDSAAAMRYTEARMTPVALEMLRDLDKDTVKFSLNFDDTLKEPDLLPGRFPNLLVNGASGIAVGLATNIPPHNMAEAIDAAVLVLDNPDVSLDEIMKVMPCPDFPTGGYILESPEIRAAYETGRAKITVRAKTEIEEQKNGKKLIVITEMPYQVNKARALEDILKISEEKKVLFAGISGIRDESDRMGMRAVIEVKKDADAEKILQYLYKYSDLQTTFGVNMVAIADGKPQTLGVKEILKHYIAYQEDVVTRRTKFDLDAAERREHILEGLMVAIANIDEVIALIRAAKSPRDAREALVARFELTETQAQAILDLRLQRLTNLERLAIEKEYKEVRRLIKEYKAILASKDKLRAVIRAEMLAIKEKYAVPRRTRLIAGEEEIVVAREDMIVVDDAVVALLDGGKIRRMPKRQFSIEQLEAEKPLFIMETQTDKKLYMFTNIGNCLMLSVEEIPEVRANAKAVNLNSLVQLEKDERIVACYDDMANVKLLFYTKKGSVKLTSGAEYDIRAKRTAAMSLKDGDGIVAVEKVSGEGSILMISRCGMSIRFETDTVPEMGKSAGGVKCMKLDKDDEVMFASQIGDEGEILTISDRGYAKRSLALDYEIQGRNGKGLKTFDFKKNGSNGTAIAAAFYVREPYDVIITQFHGTETRLNTENVLIEQRAGKGMLTIMALLDDIVTGGRKALS